MLLTILARMSNDEQRLQLLQTLRNKLSNYNLDWFDIRNIINFFSIEEHRRFDILQFLLLHIKNKLTDQIDIESYILLSNQYTNENEQFKFRLFEQISEKLIIRNQKDFQRITDLFQTMSIKQKVESIIRTKFIPDKQEEAGDQYSSSLQLTLHPEQTTANQILPPTSSFVEQLSMAPLKRKYSFDNEYQDHICHQMLTPSLVFQQDEFIQQQHDFLPCSSSSSSVSSASDENIPIRTRSFMVAIKSTFERLRETSS